MRMRQQCIPGRFSLPTKWPGNEASSIPANHPGFSGIIPDIQAMSRCPDVFLKIPDLTGPLYIIDPYRILVEEFN